MNNRKIIIRVEEVVDDKLFGHETVIVADTIKNEPESFLYGVLALMQLKVSNDIIKGSNMEPPALLKINEPLLKINEPIPHYELTGSTMPAIQPMGVIPEGATVQWEPVMGHSTVHFDTGEVEKIFDALLKKHTHTILDKIDSTYPNPNKLMPGAFQPFPEHWKVMPTVPTAITTACVVNVAGPVAASA